MPSTGENADIFTTKYEMSRSMRLPIMWYVRPAKAQTSLRIISDKDPSFEKVSEYDQYIQQSHTADQPTAP